MKAELNGEFHIDFDKRVPRFLRRWISNRVTHVRLQYGRKYMEVWRDK